MTQSQAPEPKKKGNRIDCIVIIGLSLTIVGTVYQILPYYRSENAESCGGFLVNDPPADILKEAIPTEEEKEYLRSKINCYRDQIQANSRDAASYTNMGEALRRLGSLENSRAAHQKALEINSRLQEAKIGLSLVEQDLGNAPAANQALQAAISERESAITYFYQGRNLSAQKDLEGAETAYRKAIELDANLAKAHYHLGVVLADQGKLEEAIASYRRTIAINPNLAEPYHNLGLILTNQGKLEEAVASYRRAIAINPYLAEPHNNLGVVLKRQGKLEEAVASYRRAIDINPNYAEAHNNLGNALADQGKLEEAVASYRRAIAINPDYAQAHYHLGVVLKRQGKLEEAVASYRRAIAIDPNYAEAHSNLGNALYRQGKITESLESFRKARELYRRQGKIQQVDQIDQFFKRAGVE